MLSPKNSDPRIILVIGSSALKIEARSPPIIKVPACNSATEPAVIKFTNKILKVNASIKKKCSVLVIFKVKTLTDCRSFYVYHSIGERPFWVNRALAFEKCLQPKKPREAESGLGCTEVSL